jgi:hypothetical protein
VLRGGPGEVALSVYLVAYTANSREGTRIFSMSKPGSPRALCWTARTGLLHRNRVGPQLANHLRKLSQLPSHQVLPAQEADQRPRIMIGQEPEGQPGRLYRLAR